MSSIKNQLQLTLLVLAFQPCLFARTKIPVQKEPDISLEGPTAPSRAPSREDSLIDVYIEDSCIYIFSMGQSDFVSFSISYEDNHSVILSGDCIMGDDIWIIDLSSLLSGNYALSIQINGTQYRGYFDIE